MIHGYVSLVLSFSFLKMSYSYRPDFSMAKIVLPINHHMYYDIVMCYILVNNFKIYDQVETQQKTLPGLLDWITYHRS